MKGNSDEPAASFWAGFADTHISKRAAMKKMMFIGIGFANAGQTIGVAMVSGAGFVQLGLDGVHAIGMGPIGALSVKSPEGNQPNGVSVITYRTGSGA